MAKEVWIIIVNPVAGKRSTRELAQRMKHNLSEYEIDVWLSLTKAHCDAERLTRRAVEAGSTNVIVCGGDGTVYEAVNGLMSAPDASLNTTLGIIPSGQCNDLAAILGFRMDPRNVADALMNADTQTIDLGCVRDRCYVTVATLGFDSEVNQYVDQGSPLWHPVIMGGWISALLMRFQSYKPCSPFLRCSLVPA